MTLFIVLGSVVVVAAVVFVGVTLYVESVLKSYPNI